MTEIKVVREDEKATAILRAIQQIDVGEELAPVAHGRWAALDDDCEELEGEHEAMRWGCSACHEVVEYDDWTHRSRLTRFCPNCGAKMDGGKNDG